MEYPGTDPDEAEFKKNCESCGSLILMVKSENGRWFPLHHERVTRGMFAIEDGVAYHVPDEYRDVPYFEYHGLYCGAGM